MACRKGAEAEAMAATYLRARGLSILEQNYRVRGAEIDIIAKEDDQIVFVEVKSRTRTCGYAPRESVTLPKQRRICKAALAWLQREGSPDANVRFDIIEIVRENVSHLRHAFPYVE